MENFYFRNHTTIGIGGPAESLTICNSTEEVIDLATALQVSNLPYLLLGGGSNLVVSDRGFEGKAIKLNIKKREMSLDNEFCHLTVGAGEDFDSVIQEVVEEDWTGIELLSGIPGLVGAAPIQNIGAFGAEVSDTIEKVICLDTENNQIVELENEECQFGYRSSIFNGKQKGRYWILFVEFKLKRAKHIKIEYPALIELLEAEKVEEILLVREAVLLLRKERGMLVGDGMPRSAGSFFKNPIVSSDLLKKIQVSYPDGVPCYPQGEEYKIPAAWLIGQTEFIKGYSRDGVGVSKLHNLCLINHGNGGFDQLMSLASDIQKSVRDKFEISLKIEPEICF